MSGALVLQDPQRPTAVLRVLERLATSDVVGFRVAVAYTTLGGCEVLMPRLADRVGDAGWEAVSKTVITSTDFGLTEPAAIEYLQERGVEVRFPVDRASSFHPKLYILDSPGSSAALAGSANLTRAALTTNSEVAAVLSPVADRAELDKVWSDLMETSIPVDASVLADYAERRQRQPPPLPPDRPPPSAPKPDSGSLVVFADAVESGAVDPTEFDHMWIEAGSMSSSASHSQLEGPRRFGSFFALAEPDYDSSQETFGAVALISSDRRWRGTTFAWHGDNRMERVNLPTPDKGGFLYAGAAILFSRRGNDFELTVAPWDSPVAASWRAASQAVGHEYRLGRKGGRGKPPRLCGLF